MFNLGRFLAPFRRKPLSAYQLALRSLEHGHYEEALRQLDALLNDETHTARDRATILNKRGVALIGLGRREDARRAFEEALGLQPGFAPALVNLGNLLLESGETEAAVKNYEAAILSDEKYGPAHHNLAVAYKRLGRTADSVRELRRSHKL